MSIREKIISVLDIRREIDKAIKEVLDTGQYILGNSVKKFEKEVALFHKKKYAVGVNSGTDALMLSLRTLGIKEGDEVITTPFTFIAAAEVIAQTGAKPVFVDINYKDFLINPFLIEKAITEKTKAIIPVHLFGQVCDMKEIMRISKKYGISVVEDAAQAFGKEGLGKGDFLCFSFHPSKCLGGCGDGGMILTDNKKHCEILRSLRNHGADLSKGTEGKYYNIRLGFNSRLDEIQAAYLREKLKYFKKEKIKRLWTFRTKNRDLLKKYLDKLGLDNKIYYTRLLHLQPAFKYLGYKKKDFPVAEQSAKECLSVNLYQSYKEYAKD